MSKASSQLVKGAMLLGSLASLGAVAFAAAVRPPAVSFAAAVRPPAVSFAVSESGHHLYVSDLRERAVLRYRLANGVPAREPDLVIGGFREPRGIAVDSNGYLYVADGPAKTVVILKPGSTAPEYVLTLPHPPTGVAVDSSSDVYVAMKYLASFEGQTVWGAEESIFSPFPSGPALPLTTFDEGPFGIDNGIAVNPIDGSYAVAQIATPIIYVILSPLKNPASWQIFPPCTGSGPNGAAYDSRGGLYVPDVNAGNVRVFPNPLSQGSPCPPLYTISSATQPLKKPAAVAVSGGRVFVASAFDSTLHSAAVFVFRAGVPGAQTPLAVLSGRASRLDAPSGVAVGP
jgi:NHL repeat-containing protein